MSFPLFAKIDVNGPSADPLYAWLRAETGGGAIVWNFEKFVVGKDGTIVERLHPKEAPDGAALRTALDRALA